MKVENIEGGVMNEFDKGGSRFSNRVTTVEKIEENGVDMRIY